MKNIQKSTLMQYVDLINNELKNQLLNNTKIKEPITKGKIKWHGIRLVFQRGKYGDCYWLEQRGKQIGEKIKFHLTVNINN